MNSLYKNIHFLKNDAYSYKDYAICGIRGWTIPDINSDEKDIRIYKRELNRLELSLKAGKKISDKIIVSLHFPPTNDLKEESGFTKLIEEYNVEKTIYGHVHGEECFNTSIMGQKHLEICTILNDIYTKKNHDYGDSFAKLRGELSNAILVRIYDKYSRLKTLLEGADQKVIDESIDDTLMQITALWN